MPLLITKALSENVFNTKWDLTLNAKKKKTTINTICVRNSHRSPKSYILEEAMLKCMQLLK